ncbi:Syntaxin-12 [Paramyrothecium foliicola]|nr:Syntaxin-12 [Paramyrothecium foliicola]
MLLGCTDGHVEIASAGTCMHFPTRYLSSLESGQRAGYSDDPGFQDLLYNLKSKLQSLLSSNRKLSNDVGALGTKRDTPRLRERVHGSMEKTRDICKEIGDGIKKLQTWEDLSKQQKYEQTKVSSDFQAALQEFQGLQRTALEKQRASVTAARAAHESESGPGDEGSGAQLQQLQQQDLSQFAPQDEVDFQEALIIEREEEIRNIEQGVGDLNVLFRQVAQIVTEQGEQLGTIEDNVENVRTDTRQADIENRQAARYQKAARNKSCCLLLILAVILTIVLLAIFLD